jgi:hypothetical protein
MHQGPIYSHAPVAESGRLRLARVVDPDGRGRRQEVSTFEAEVLWIREITPTVAVMHGGEIVTREGTCCDVGAFGSAIDEAAADARAYCRRFKVDAASSMSVVVLATVREIPVLQYDGDPSEARGFGGGRRYDPVPEGWMLDDRRRIEACLAARRTGAEWPDGGFPALCKRALVADAEVWTSRRPPRENTAAILDFKRRWTPGEKPAA